MKESGKKESRETKENKSSNRVSDLRKDKDQQEKQTRGYYRFYHSLKPISRPIEWILFGLRKKYELALPEEPCLVLVNHTCYFDPVIVGMCIKQPVYFVTAENLLRHRLAAFIALKIFHSIPCSKGKQNIAAVYDIARNIRAGHNVVMFAEGNITYDGATAEVVPSTGKLAKILKCTVVTVRVEGAYLIMPRWSHKFCFQKVHSTIAGVYRPEDLKTMSANEILDHINRDLYVEQPPAGPEAVQVARRKTKGLKYLLYACPHCGQLGKITEHGHEIHCECGSSWTLNRYGQIEGEKVRTLYEWNRWQKEHIRQMVQEGQPIEVSVPNTELCLITDDHERQKRDEGLLRMNREYLACGQSQFPLDTLSGLDTRNQGVLIFSLKNGDYFEIQSREGYPGLLFKTIYEMLKAEKTG